MSEEAELRAVREERELAILRAALETVSASYIELVTLAKELEDVEDDFHPFRIHGQTLAAARELLTLRTQLHEKVRAAEMFPLLRDQASS